MHLRDAQLLRHGVGRALPVAGEHDDAHAVRPQAGHRLARAGLRLVGDDDVAEIRAVGRDVDDRTGLIDRGHGQAEGVHQLRVAGGNRPAADLRGHAVTGELFGVRRDQVGRKLSGRAAQALADWVIGKLLRRRRKLQQRLIGQLRLRGMHRRDGERAARERAGLVKDDTVGLGQHLQIARTLDEDTAGGRAADAAEERQRDRDHECARAADDEERQRAVDPVSPLCRDAHNEPHDRRQDRQRERRTANGRRVDAGKLRDEALSVRLFERGIFHQLEDARDRGLGIHLLHAQAQHTRQVHAAADDGAALRDVHGGALAGQGAHIQRRRTREHRTVERDTLAGLDDDRIADCDLLGLHPRDAVRRLDIGVVRADVHQVADVFAAAADGVALKQLADLVKQHDGHGLGIVPEHHRADGGHGHEQVFVERLAVINALAGIDERLAADEQIRDKIQHELEPARDRHKVQPNEQHGRCCYEQQRPFLFARHEIQSSKRKSGSTLSAVLRISALASASSTPGAYSTSIFCAM